MRRFIGMDIHRSFGEVVCWEEGKLRHGGRVDITRTALEGFGKSLFATDELVIEATGNCMAVLRVLSPFVKRVVIANPLQVKGLTPYEFIFKRWTSEPDRFIINSIHQMPGLNT